MPKIIDFPKQRIVRDADDVALLQYIGDDIWKWDRERRAREDAALSNINTLRRATEIAIVEHRANEWLIISGGRKS